ncbi:TonB-dependent receptor plug domain-containing protein, partial [Pseudomonas sp. KB_15]|uniref:TonB-dependent receptor plug domain-containing protein n=1 Tax=Pseudomonas sp. KB_15 TaxID=3233035 RepID=UPI003F994752
MLAASLGAVAGLNLPCAFAQETSEQKDTSLPPVVVSEAIYPGLALSKPEYTGSRMGLTPLETPASVEVISGETIRARGDQSVREAVTRATGITGNPSPGNGGTSLTARGFAGQGSVMQLLD